MYSIQTQRLSWTLALALISTILIGWFFLSSDKSLNNIGLRAPKGESFVLVSDWNLSGGKSFSRNTLNIEPGTLSEDGAIAIVYDLNGLCLLDGPSSAIVLTARDGKTFGVPLLNYANNCFDGEQVSVISLSDYSIDRPIDDIAWLFLQIWSPTSYTIDIRTIISYKPESDSFVKLSKAAISELLKAQITTSTPTPTFDNQPPVAIATATVISNIPPAPVEFRGYQSYDPDGDQLTYRWSLGDGNAVNELNANHTYFKSGTYIAQFSVSDGVHTTFANPITVNIISATPAPTPTPQPEAGPPPAETPSPMSTPSPTSTPSPMSTVGNQPPVAIATVTIISSVPPAPVEFRGYRSYDSDGDQLTYHWSFGDGNSVNGQDANHTYLNSGTYVAQFSVSDGVHTTFASPITVSIIGDTQTPTPTPSVSSEPTSSPSPTVSPSALPVPSPIPTPTQDPSVSNPWIYCADEHELCDFNGTKEIRYGANGLYAYLVVTDGVPCENNVFSDPIVGTFKQCHYRNMNTPDISPWSIRSVSSMKITKDAVCNQVSNDFIESWIDRAVELGVNYIAVATPYDNPLCGNSVSYTKAWSDAIHARGLNVWHRHMPLAFEGIYNTPKDSSKNYLQQISDYIKANPTIFEEGDIFTPVPEPQNGGIAGITYCPQNVCIFSDAADFNHWLRVAISVSESAFSAIGLGGKMKIGYYGFDGFVAWGDNNADWNGILEDETIRIMGNITVDHYPGAVGSTMAQDLDELQARYPNTPIIIGEWGTITTLVNPVEQVHDVMSAAIRQNIIGFNYWHMGMGGNEALINWDFSKRPTFNAVQSFFTR